VNLGLIGSLLDILPCNDMIVNIWASNIPRDDRNRVDTHRSSTYYVAEVAMITVGIILSKA